jgi:hypothetical protein
MVEEEAVSGRGRQEARCWLMSGSFVERHRISESPVRARARGLP